MTNSSKPPTLLSFIAMTSSLSAWSLLHPCAQYRKSWTTAARLYWPWGVKPKDQRGCGMDAKSVTNPFGTTILRAADDVHHVFRGHPELVVAEGSNQRRRRRLHRFDAEPGAEDETSERQQRQTELAHEIPLRPS